MAKILKNKKLQKYNRFHIPQDMLELCNELRIPKHHVNYFGDRGFIIEQAEKKDVFRILHHRWGAIAKADTHINEWTGLEIKRYFHEAYHFENKSDSPEDEYRRILKEKWLTEIDLQVVSAVYFHRILTTTQLANFGFYKSKSALRQIRSRCKQLVDNFVLESFQPAPDRVVGAAENHYMLGEVGAYFIANQLNKPIRDIIWTPRHNEVMMHTVFHTIEINNVFHAFRLEANNRREKIELAATDRTAYLQALEKEFSVDKTIAEYLITENIKRSEGNVRFNPDGLLIVKYQGESVPLFLEVDRNTMDLVDFAAKVPRYEAYARSMLWQHTFGTMPAVIVCTTDEKRMIELSRIVNHTQKLKDIPWLFTTLEKVKSAPLGYIWIHAKDASKKEFEYVSLLDAF